MNEIVKAIHVGRSHYEGGLFSIVKILRDRTAIIYQDLQIFL